MIAMFPLAVIQLYGLLIAAAVAVGAWLCTREEKRLSLPKDTGLDIVLYAVPLAVVFARIYYVIFSWQQFAQQPLRVFYVWEGGLAIYGGVIGGALGVWLLSKRRGIRFSLLADVVAPALLLGQAIGRWGNYFNGEAFGDIISSPQWQFFPVAVFVQGQWHMATFFYESLWNFLGFIFLYRSRRRFGANGRTGHVFLWYMAWYGMGRLYIEGLRTDSLMLGDIRISQLVSLVLCASGLLLIARGLKAPWPAWAGIALAAVCAVVFLMQGTPMWGAAAAMLFVAAGVWLYRLYSEAVHA
jgi:phosphatidylglycerol:prolipoprotein diacylglycerol transferase